MPDYSDESVHSVWRYWVLKTSRILLREEIMQRLAGCRFGNSCSIGLFVC